MLDDKRRKRDPSCRGCENGDGWNQVERQRRESTISWREPKMVVRSKKFEKESRVGEGREVSVLKIRVRETKERGGRVSCRK